MVISKICEKVTTCQLAISLYEESNMTSKVLKQFFSSGGCFLCVQVSINSVNRDLIKMGIMSRKPQNHVRMWI